MTLENEVRDHNVRSKKSKKLQVTKLDVRSYEVRNNKS